MNFAKKVLIASLALGYAAQSEEEKPNCFIYRDDIGAFWGIKGYEEQVTEVGTHHGFLDWPQFRFFGTFDSGSVRRGNLFYYHSISINLVE
jgi:ubiquinol-cytochrome c reductase cytochrome c1 subunit